MSRNEPYICSSKELSRVYIQYHANDSLVYCVYIRRVVTPDSICGIFLKLTMRYFDTVIY